ncbi:phage baseplate plug family protein [Secundilactobacillus kimchicus]|uniref:phage baseplate plug family protein n=1 Tax=Secundilactobacillus kimchicus TaxID=528209 RepID=UPI0024A85A64|nr:hypothetical protein [Secundilactobacillus kimchicus]
MVHDTINVDPKELPYEFQVTIDGIEYTVKVYYNPYCDQVFISIADDDGVIGEEPIVLGQQLFQTLPNDRLPTTPIVPLDESGHAVEANVDNLNQTVFLCLGDIEIGDINDNQDDE